MAWRKLPDSRWQASGRLEIVVAISTGIKVFHNCGSPRVNNNCDYNLPVGISSFKH